MRKALILAGIALLSLAALNLWTWRQLTAAREQASELRERLASGSASQIASLSHALPVYPPDMGAAGTTPTEDAAPVSANPGLVGSVDPQVLFRDPDYLRAWRTQTRAGIDTMYPGLQQALKLSPEMADRLQELFVDHLLASNMTAVRIVDGQFADPNQQDELQQRQQKEQDEIATLLGPARMAAFEEYKDNLQFRGEVNILRAGMGSGPGGMRDDQVEALIPIYRAAVERESGSLPPGPAIPGPGPIDPVQWGADSARSREHDKALHARILEGARAVLDSRQLALLELGFRRQEELDEAGAIILQKQWQGAGD